MAIPATAASDTESFLPIDRAASDRCENDVFNASNRLTTILMNLICAKKMGKKIVVMWKSL